MKKKIAIVTAILMSMGSMSACGQSEKVNNLDTTVTVNSTVAVSVSENISKSSEATQPQTSPVSSQTISSTTEPIEETKADTSQISTESTQNIKTYQTVETSESDIKHTISNNNTSPTKQQKTYEPASEKQTGKPVPEPTQKPTQKPTQAKVVDIQSVISACISYGQSLGMRYDISLNTLNASWFSPTNATYYDDTTELTVACYSDVEYVAYFYQESGILPSDLSFNVISEDSKIYVVYN